MFGFKSKKKKLDKIKPSSMGSLGFGNRWSKYETKRPKNLTMLCTIHIIRGNKVITVLLVKLLGCQITSKHPFFCKKMKFIGVISTVQSYLAK